MCHSLARLFETALGCRLLYAYERVQVCDWSQSTVGTHHSPLPQYFQVLTEHEGGVSSFADIYGIEHLLRMLGTSGRVNESQFLTIILSPSRPALAG